MTYEIDIVSHIAERIGGLRAAEKKVARLVVDDIAFAANASVSAIAERAGVSDATVTRFARAVDCRNVRDLKFRLAQTLAVGQRFLSESDNADGRGAIYDDIALTLERNRELLDNADVTGAVQALDGSRQIIAFGAGGGSSVFARELQYRLMRFGYAVSAYCDALLPHMVAATLDPHDVIVALSVTGQTREIVEAARIARQSHAQIVAITNRVSPLAEEADFVLPLVTSETDFIYKPSASRYALLAIIDVLATELALSHRERTRDKLRRLKHTLDTHRGGDNRQPLGD